MKTMFALKHLTMAAFAIVLMSGCAKAPVKTTAMPAVLDAIEDIAAENGDRILVIRDYVDELKIDGKDVRRRFQYAWNYTRAVAQLREFELSGELLKVGDVPGITLNATEPEKAFAFSAVQANARWKSLYREDSTFYGGFSFRQKNHPVCGPGSRCIHVFASDTGGRNTTLHVIFDLMTGYSEAAPSHVDPSGRTIINPSPETAPK